MVRLLLVMLLAVSLFAGCTSPPAGSPPKGEPPGSSATPNPDLPPGVYPPEYRTNQPQLDAVIDAHLNKDVDRLMELVVMQQAGCNPDEGLHCGDQPKGTPKLFFPRSTCQTNYVTDLQAVRTEMALWVEGSRYFYAAYRVQNLGPRAYYLIFASGLADSEAKRVYLDADGKIIELGLGCNAPTAPLQGEYYTPIVAPAST